jgi:hypothetical protein
LQMKRQLLQMVNDHSRKRCDSFNICWCRAAKVAVVEGATIETKVSSRDWNWDLVQYQEQKNH